MCAVAFAGAAQAQTAGAGTAAPTALLQQGSVAMQRGDLPGAEASFRKAISEAPRSGEAYLGLGLVQLREGGLDQAIASLSKATTLGPKLGGAHLFLGIAEYQKGDATAAITALHKELALDAHNVEALMWMGIIQLASGHPEAATAPLDQAVALQGRDPNLLYYRARAHSLVAEETYKQLNEEAPDSALVHRALAESLAGAGQPEKAIAEYQTALRKEPGNPDLYEGLGEQEQKLSRFDAAREAYEQELRVNPNSGVALYNLGKMDVDAGKPESGIALLRRAEATHVSEAPTAYYLGYGLEQTGQTEEAAHWLEQSLASQPSPFIQQGALFQLARVYQRLGRKTEAQRALDQLKQAKAAQSPEATATGSLSSSGALTTEQPAPDPGKP